MAPVQPASTRRRLAGGVAIAAALALLLPGCGKGGSLEAAGRTRTVTVTTTSSTSASGSRAGESGKRAGESGEGGGAGGEGGEPGHTGESGGGEEPRSEGEAHAKAAAEAFVAAVNLHGSDLPGFSIQRESPESKREPAAPELSRCLGGSSGGGASSGGELASGSSPTFSRHSRSLEVDTVQSNVSVALSEEQAKGELQRIKSAHTGVCLARYVEAELRSKPLGGGKLRGVQQTQIAAPADSFGWRLTAVLEIHKLQLPLYLELLGFVEGRAEIALTVFAFPQRLATSEERHLLELLRSRASAHKL